MIVVDTQLLVYLTAPSAFSLLAERVALLDRVWHTTPLWRSEYRSVVAGEIRRGNMTHERALASFLAAEALLWGEHSPGTAEVLSLVGRSTCSAYDLEFVAVALGLNVPLVTNDKQVLAEFPGIAISPEAFAA